MQFQFSFLDDFTGQVADGEFHEQVADRRGVEIHSLG